MYGESALSPDYPGPLVRRLEAEHDVPFIFLTGTAGDQSPPDTTGFRAGTELCEKMGEALGELAAKAAAEAEAVGSEVVRVERDILRIPQRELRPGQVDAAWEHVRALARGERPASVAPALYGYAWHFHGNPQHVDDWLAHEIVGMWEWRRRGGPLGIVEDVEVQVLRIGDVAIVGFPCELFSRLGREVRERSPFAHTLAVEHANAFRGYVPREEDFERGGYECCFAMQSRLAVDAGRRMTDAALGLLGAAAAHNADTA